MDNTKVESPRTGKPQLSEDCKCAKSKDPDFDDETADANIHASIAFENTLQNFVYVK